MPDQPSEFEKAVVKLRTDIFAAMELHDEECGSPKDCMERINVIAFLAHSVGIKSEHILPIDARLNELRHAHNEHLRICKDPGHEH